jgi:hypothetical protein
MHTPKVSQCLICEDVRNERFGKLSIIGFYGFLPRTKILIKDIHGAIDRLLFVIFLEEVRGDFNITIEIISPDKKEPIRLKGELTQLSDISRGRTIALGISRYVPNVEGDFKVNIFANKKLIFKSYMSIQIGPSEVFV